MGGKQWIRLHAVKSPVDGSRDGFNLCAKLLLNAEEVVAILVRDQVDGKAQMAKTA